MSFVSFAVSLISIFGFRRYKQQYRARYSRDVFRASAFVPSRSPEEAAQSSSLGGEDYVHIIIDLFTLSFVCASNYLSLKQVSLVASAESEGVQIADSVECAVMCLFMIYTSWPELKARLRSLLDCRTPPKSWCWECPTISLRRSARCCGASA